MQMTATLGNRAWGIFLASLKARIQNRGRRVDESLSDKPVSLQPSDLLYEIQLWWWYSMFGQFGVGFYPPLRQALSAEGQLEFEAILFFRKCM